MSTVSDRLRQGFCGCGWVGNAWFVMSNADNELLEHPRTHAPSPNGLRWVDDEPEGPKNAPPEGQP